MHWMDARALRRKDAFRGERPWGDTVCDPWISDRETLKEGKSTETPLVAASESGLGEKKKDEDHFASAKQSIERVILSSRVSKAERSSGAEPSTTMDGPSYAKVRSSEALAKSHHVTLLDLLCPKSTRKA
ncbi:unnamed protein product [Victoria cruziana]